MELSFGYIVDGDYHDTSAVKKLSFPLFYFFNTPEDEDGQRSIKIRSVEISTDDFIVTNSESILLFLQIECKK